MSDGRGCKHGLRAALALMVLGGAPFAMAQEANERAATVGVQIVDSKLHGGAFALAGTARICGEVPKELNFAGVPAFGVLFYPDTPPPRGGGEVTDLTFDSKELVGDVTTSGSFYLSITVQSVAIGSPYALVLDTTKPKMSGIAKLTRPSREELRLTVEGVNDVGETVTLQLICGPKR
jgi:hypothetical protein